MLRIAAIALLGLSGGLHGIYTHRWDSWAESVAGTAVDRIERVPLRAGAWEGERIEVDTLTLPEEMVGRAVSVRFVNRITGSTATVFLSCGPTDSIAAHTPRVCYPVNGYPCSGTDLRASPAPAEDPAPEFWVSNFTKPDALAPIHLRVIWAWSDGRGWQVPGNPLRTFRRSPVIYKCYVVRQVISPDEPVENDPGMQLLAALLPELDGVLSGR
ncbi:hypothetical protein J8F10_32985 [Gemmata sp. G18]|uniref:Exosortase-associated EpsI family protein n=1 Tax=Gemmata palustris TaxID=2822762 RepID=A0ABS5C264_9BACT|nr:hypothetical protein [Gemmata palustris]MBP3960068.1 hypothetical protein [Gemmata palustris]